MLRKRAELMGAAFYVVDLCLLVFSAAAAYRLRASIDAYFTGWPDYVPLFGLMVALWSVLLYSVKAYELPRGRTFATDLGDILKVSVLGFCLAGAIIFGFRLHFVSRLLVGVFAVITFPVLLLGRCVLRFVLARTTAPDRRIVIVGNGSRAEEIRRTIEEESH